MLQNIYLNNSLETWLYAFATMILAVVLGKLVYWGIQKTVKVYTKKTKNDFDYILVDMIEEPLTLALTLSGVWFSLSLLQIDAKIHTFIYSILYFIVICNIAWFLTRLFDALMERYVVDKVKATETDLDDLLLPIVRKLITISIWVLTVIIGIDNAGYDVTTMLTGVGIGGLVFALAAQDTVSNLFGSFVIFSDKPFGLHDRIILDNYEGYVREIGLRSIKLETLDKRMVSIPNSMVTDNSVLNISREPARKIQFTLGLTYNTTPENLELAKKLLDAIFQNNEGLDNHVVFFENFGDFSLNIRCIFWIKKGHNIFQVQDSVNMEILKQFNANKLDFAFPTQTIITEKNA